MPPLDGFLCAFCHLLSCLCPLISLFYVNIECEKKLLEEHHLCRSRTISYHPHLPPPQCFWEGLQPRALRCCSSCAFRLYDGFHLHAVGELGFDSDLIRKSFFLISGCSLFKIVLVPLVWETDRDVTILTWFWFLLPALPWDAVFPWGPSMKKHKMHLSQFCCPACLCSINMEWTVL